MSGLSDQMESDARRDEALAWLIRVQSDAATGEDWAALTAWLEASEENLAAFESVERLDHDISVEAADIARGVAAPDDAVVPFRRRSKPRTAWALGGGLAAAAAVAAIMLGPVAWNAARNAYDGQPVTYRTSPGESREIALADGSHIRLDGASALTVRLGLRARRVEMAQAEASFDVARDPRRPFVISVGDQQVRVVGTQFNIRHVDQSVVVTVRRGIVEVRQPALGAQPVARLTPGQELRHIEGQSRSVSAQVDPQVAFAWTEGRMICADRPLGEIVADLNRRYPKPIRLSDRAAQRRFSGVLDLKDEASLVQRLADYLSLTVHRTDKEITLD